MFRVNQKKKFYIKSINQKMFDIEKNMDSFKESINKSLERLERNEGIFNNLVDKVQSIEVTQNEYKKRLRRLEDRRIQGENDDIELQQVKSILFLIFLIINF